MSASTLVKPQNTSSRLATLGQPGPAFRLLDTYSPTGVAEESDLPRIDALATISAGEKVERNGKEIPQASRDGKISLHDPENMAPGLRAALESTGFKRLSIAFPYDNPADFIQQRFVEYSASSLVIYGDETKLTFIDGNGHHDYLAGTHDYEMLLRRPTLKVSTSVYFHLAEWSPEGPQVVFPDGLGLYRLRFTSRNSLRALKTSLEYIMRFTSGRIAGIPLELSIGYREVSGPDGKRRKVAVWQCRMKPPENQKLTSNSFRFLANDSLKQGANLILPPPERETLALAAHEEPVVDLDEAEIEVLEKGGLCDATHWRQTYFAAFGDTELAKEHGRAAFLRKYTHGAYDSLSAFLANASEDEARALIEAGRDELEQAKTRKSSELPADYEQNLKLYGELVETAEGFGVLFRGTDAWPRMNRPRPGVLSSALASVQKALEDAGIEAKTAGEMEAPQTPLGQAVREKRVAASGQKPKEEQPQVSEPDPMVVLMEAVTAAGFVDPKTGDVDEFAMCVVINNALAQAGRDYGIESLGDLIPSDRALALKAIQDEVARAQ